VVITPDDKDWTWVLERPCPECGFDASQTACTDVAAQLRAALLHWSKVLTERDDIRRRPRPEVWSPLEYGCHVRDVCRVYTARVRRMLDEAGPRYPNWDQDQTAVDDDYQSQNPDGVAEQLRVDGLALAELFDGVDADQWQRTGFRSDGAAFTVDTISRYFLHDVVHHLMDVRA
jgi:DinB superfamily